MDEEMNPMLVAETLEGIATSLKSQLDLMKESTLTSKDACQSVIDEVVKHENSDIFLNGGAAAGYGNTGEGDGAGPGVAAVGERGTDDRFQNTPAQQEAGGGGCCVIS